jgi:hypothetical protein
VLDIDKVELKKKFKEEDWEYVFDKVYRISEFIIARNYKIFNHEIMQDMKQECAENFFKKILQNKINPEKNVFSFIWRNSEFRILEILRKENNRRRIVNFMPFDMADFEIYKNKNIGLKYVEESA